MSVCCPSENHWPHRGPCYRVITHTHTHACYSIVVRTLSDTMHSFIQGFSQNPQVYFTVFMLLYGQEGWIKQVIFNTAYEIVLDGSPRNTWPKLQLCIPYVRISSSVYSSCSDADLLTAVTCALGGIHSSTVHLSGSSEQIAAWWSRKLRRRCCIQKNTLGQRHLNLVVAPSYMCRCFTTKYVH